MSDSLTTTQTTLKQKLNGVEVNMSSLGCLNKSDKLPQHLAYRWFIYCIGRFSLNNLHHVQYILRATITTVPYTVHTVERCRVTPSSLFGIDSAFKKSIKHPTVERLHLAWKSHPYNNHIFPKSQRIRKCQHQVYANAPIFTINWIHVFSIQGITSGCPKKKESKSRNGHMPDEGCLNWKQTSSSLVFQTNSSCAVLRCTCHTFMCADIFFS